MANLTNALRKNLSHGFIIFLWLFALYDVVAMHTTRMSVDKKATITLLVMIPVGLCLNVIWMILLAFCNNNESMRRWKKEKRIATDIFPLFFIPFTITIFVFLYYDNSYTTYKNACYAVSGLISIYFHMFLGSTWLVPKELQTYASGQNMN